MRIEAAVQPQVPDVAFGPSLEVVGFVDRPSSVHWLPRGQPLQWPDVKVTASTTVSGATAPTYASFTQPRRRLQ